MKISTVNAAKTIFVPPWPKAMLGPLARWLCWCQCTLACQSSCWSFLGILRWVRNRSDTGTWWKWATCTTFTSWCNLRHGLRNSRAIPISHSLVGVAKVVRARFGASAAQTSKLCKSSLLLHLLHEAPINLRKPVVVLHVRDATGPHGQTDLGILLHQA